MSDSPRQGAEPGPSLRLQPRGFPRFLLLLSAALVFLVVTPFLGVSPLGALGRKLILTVLLIVAVSELQPSQVRIGLVLAMVAIGADLLNTLVQQSGLFLAVIATRAVFFFYVASVVLYGVLRQRTVTLDTIAGAACVYLFIGFMWAMLFALLDHLEPGSIHFPEAWMGHPAGTETETARYVYFSFVTLTTLGYGDIVPQTVDASGLVVAEAVVGQLYLAVLVARLVGLHLVSRKKRKH